MLFCQFSKPICPFAELGAGDGANHSRAETGERKRTDHPFWQQRLVRSAEVSDQRSSWPVTTDNITGDVKTQHWGSQGKAKRDRNYTLEYLFPGTQKHQEKIRSTKKMVPVPRGATDISPKEVYQAQTEML